MKKFLTLLSVLCLNLAGFAQTPILTPVDFYIKNAGNGEILYTVTAVRNESTYPYTVAKNNEFRTAVANGTIARTTSEGCIIPAGVRAPLTKPTCSAPTGPAYASASYGFDGERLTVNATVTVSGGDNVKMRFENADGSGFSILNPDNVLIDNNTFYYGAEPTATTRRWVVKVPNANPKKVTIRRESDQSVYSTTFTPIVGATNTQLFAATSSTVTQPPSQTITNPGSGTTTDALFSFAVPATASPWHSYSNQQIGFIKKGQDGYDVDVIIGDYDQYENEFLIVQIRNGMGGFVQVTDKATGRKLNNGPDLGRGNAASSYSTQDYTNNANYIDPKTGQHKFSYNGAAPAPGPWFTGYNPLLNGDFKGHPSTSLMHGFVTINGKQYTYDKRQLNSWSHANNRMEKMYHEQWINLTGKVIDMHIRLTHDRDDTKDYGPFLQEWRLSMFNGNRFNAVFYNGNQPYTFATPSRHIGTENGASINNREFGVSEPFIAVEIDDQNRNRVIAHYAPDMWSPSFEHMDPQEGSDCDGCREGMYTSGHVLANLDAKGVWLFHDTWIVGDLNGDVRPFVYAQPRPNAPVWKFNASTGRNGWVGFNGMNDPQYPNSASSTGWNLTLTGKADGGAPNLDNSFLISPRTAFKASTCPTLYFTVRSRNLSQTNWQVKYTYVGQDRESLHSQFPNANAVRYPYNPAVRSNSQAVSFTMNNDNTVRTYAIPMNWDANSHISTVEIWPAGQTPSGGNWDVQEIGCKQP